MTLLKPHRKSHLPDIMQSIEGRHDSAASVASDDTVRADNQTYRNSTSATRATCEEKLAPSQRSPEPGPHSRHLPPKDASASRTAIALWEQAPAQQKNAMGSSWPTGGAVPAGLFAQQYRDDSMGTDAGQDSRMDALRAYSSENYYSGDDRRPSVASATTVSSTGSSRSRGGFVHKKLHEFFGEDPATIESAKASESNLNLSKSSHKQPSLNSSQVSPECSRPRTPPGTFHDVAPWQSQSANDIHTNGLASRHDTTSLDSRQNGERRPSTTGSKPSVSSSGSRLHLGRHGRQKSAEDDHRPRRFREQDTGRRQALKHDGRKSTRRHPNNSSTSLEPPDGKPAQRSRSPASSQSRDASATRSNNDMSGGKRGIFDRLRHRHHKTDRSGGSGFVELVSSSAAASNTSLNTKASSRNLAANLPENATQTLIHDGGVLIPSVTNSSTTGSKNHPRMPFKSKRGQSGSELPPPKDPATIKAQAAANESLWDLDTDLTQMEGILLTSKSTTSPVASTSHGLLQAAQTKASTDVAAAAGTTSPHSQGLGSWDAPDSWAVKRVGDENNARLHEIDDNGTPHKDEDSGTVYCIRIFRPDDTFATLALPLNTSVTEIIELLRKKSFMQEELDNYHIILKKNDTSRQLDAGERPIAIQKKLLEQAGYNESDKLEDLGSQDHSYLCRFSFLPVQMSGYSRFEKDPGLNRMQKFSNVDLQGRNLINIPVALYIKSSEIVFLNLSRNLSLDVPKDFIQGCTSLREIKYTGNEAWHLPPSFSLASKLTTLDLSNNRLEQLEHAGLDKLHSLASLKLANNKLSALPAHFAHFKSLRSLNLSSNSLNELPGCVCEISTLADLDISFNAIVKLPSMTKLRSLERLLATNNRLSGPMEETVAQLRNLKEIDMRFNKIDNITVLAKLPHLEHLIAGHNQISFFMGSFAKLRTFYLDNNPVTRFRLEAPMPTLTTLNLASAKLAQLPEEVYSHATNLTKLILDKNHFVSLSESIGNLSKLEHFSIAKNSLSSLGAEMGRLSELKFLDVRENNIRKLPSEIWFCRKLDTLNLSSNLLDSFPKPPTQIRTQPVAEQVPALPSNSANATTGEEADQVGPMQRRKTSQAPSYMSSSSSSGTSTRKSSGASMFGHNPKKPSALTRPSADSTRKDSSLPNRTTMTFAGSLRHLFLADNRIPDDIFDSLSFLQELRILNLSYNELYDIPPRTLRKWQYLSELYLSGNDLSSLPSDELEDISALKVLHINNNKFQVLPAELGKVQKLAVLDASSNNLKYNVSNWPYDWNWNRNPHLKYLNLSGNKRLEIKPSNSYLTGRDAQNLTDFGALTKLRSLGLLDVTLMIASVPDTTDDRRVRTMGSSIGTMGYGIADCLGRNEHLSTIDIVVPQFDGHDDETLFGLFDGVPMSNGGSKIAKYLQENFRTQFKEELKRRLEGETPEDALRRTYLALNKDLAVLTAESNDARNTNKLPPSVHRNSISGPVLHEDDLNSGCVATVMYLHNMDLYVSNVGDAQAVLIQSEGGHRFITVKHDPASSMERQRIRDAGGFVSRQGKLNDTLEVSRAFGYTHLMPVVIAAPHTAHITITDSDEIILLASREMWDFLTPDFAIDVARSERQDLMRAAQKLRDIAIAFGASGKMTVMMIGVSDLQKKAYARFRTHSMSMGPSGLPDEYLVTRRGKRGRDATLDSRLARLDQEVDAPTGNVTLVFTDIKSSTLLWETYPIAMQSAIKMHNEVMRRHLRLIGGYEVKTEGDAFMVAFPTVTSALLWAFTIQSQLLEVPWPQEIINSVNGQEVRDAEGNVLFRGLSVRMGIHWGHPVCETDPVTRRMDYFGPMVNRAARIQSVADGGQITVSSDFIAEVQRLLETHMESDGTTSNNAEDALGEDDQMNASINRELRSLSSHGFEVKEIGERRLKGLENPEYIYLMYPHSLAGRLAIQQQQAEATKDAGKPGVKSVDSQLTIDLDSVWHLWAVSLRLEMMCSTLECPDAAELRAPETALLERTRERGGEITDRFVMNFVEHQVSRIETCVTSLALRNMVRPFAQGMLSQACSMAEIMRELSGQLEELKTLKQQQQKGGVYRELGDGTSAPANSNKQGRRIEDIFSNEAAQMHSKNDQGHSQYDGVEEGKVSTDPEEEEEAFESEDEEGEDYESEECEEEDADEADEEQGEDDDEEAEDGNLEESNASLA